MKFDDKDTREIISHSKSFSETRSLESIDLETIFFLSVYYIYMMGFSYLAWIPDDSCI